jgi:hypothetical protein
MEYETIIKSMIIKPKGEAIYHVEVTEVSIDDEAGGPYVVVRQFPDSTQEIRIGEEDWPAIRRAIEAMMIVCRGQGEGE